jgi:hypothetical protein
MATIVKEARPIIKASKEYIFKVYFSSIPLKPDTIQKKGSFIKETIKAPDPTAATERTGSIFKIASDGATTDEAVTTAIAKEPVKSFTTAAITKGTNIDN